MILEKERNEYILIYTDKNQKSFLNIDKKPLNFDKFSLVNNTIPIVDTKMSIEYAKKFFESYLSICFKYEAFKYLVLKMIL